MARVVGFVYGSAYGSGNFWHGKDAQAKTLAGSFCPASALVHSLALNCTAKTHDQPLGFSGSTALLKK